MVGVRSRCPCSGVWPYNRYATESRSSCGKEIQEMPMQPSAEASVYYDVFFVYTSVFRYSDKCPRTVAADVDSCNTKHLTHRHVLQFHADNQLVAVDRRQSIDAACKSAAVFCFYLTFVIFFIFVFVSSLTSLPVASPGFFCEGGTKLGENNFSSVQFSSVQSLQ